MSVSPEYFTQTLPNAFLSTCSPGWWKHSRRVSPNGQTHRTPPMHCSILPPFCHHSEYFHVAALDSYSVLHNKKKIEDPVFAFTDVFSFSGRDGTGTCTLQIRTNILRPSSMLSVTWSKHVHNTKLCTKPQQSAAGLPGSREGSS